jgi:hypothetical protein
MIYSDEWFVRFFNTGEIVYCHLKLINSITTDTIQVEIIYYQQGVLRMFA